MVDGTTVLLTTQYLEEADQLADNIAVIDPGRVIAEGTANELKSRVGSERMDVVLPAGSVTAAAACGTDRRSRHRNRQDRQGSVAAPDGHHMLVRALGDWTGCRWSRRHCAAPPWTMSSSS